MSEFKGLEGEITFIETDKVRNSISIGGNDSLIDVWNFGLTKEEHAELTTTITKALKIRQEINFDLIELLRQRNEMLEMLNKFLQLFSQSDMRPEDECHELAYEIKELIKPATEI